jgi:uncharacterized protein YjbI with pentapeptide repeats
VTSIELGGATWRMVQAAHCRFDDANFRSAQVEQSRVQASNCARADFGGARLDRVQLTDCDLTAADFSNARCTDLDLRGARLEQLKGIGSLRGAIIGPEQLYGLAPGLATAVGIAVRQPEDDR